MHTQVILIYISPPNVTGVCNFLVIIGYEPQVMTEHNQFRDATICRCTKQVVKGLGAVKGLRLGKWQVLIIDRGAVIAEVIETSR